MKVKNIRWDIDIEEAYERLDSMSEEQAAAALEIPNEKYADMSEDERFDYAYDCFHHHRTDIAEFMGLPDEVDIPDAVIEGAEDKEDALDIVSEWLSDEYGFCHEGFSAE